MVAESVGDLQIAARGVELFVGSVVGDRPERGPVICGGRNVPRAQRMPSEQRRIEPDPVWAAAARSRYERFCELGTGA